jgi:PAS domain S-box-containing protein
MLLTPMPSSPNSNTGGRLPRSEADARKLVHKLEVHQLELEMQNAELREARSTVETLLQTYTDLYDFAPVGYLSVDEKGMILEANLAGAVLLGLERSRLINRRFRDFIAVPARADCEAFIEKVISSEDRQVCAASLIKANGVVFSADIQAVVAASPRDGKRWVRLAISDLTGMRQAEETKRQVEGLTVSNRDLRREIFQRQKMEKALQTSQSHYAQLLEKSQHLQEQLRHLSRQLLLSQEEERKRISRELHDQVLQILVGINVHLACLIGNTPVKQQDLQAKIVRTQKLVAKSVEIVHQFARELRPTLLDDLGLIPALKSFINDFVKRTGLRVVFQACPEVAELSGSKRTVLYRVAQAALTNVHKHSQATTVKVVIRLVRKSIRMEIQDDGKSFDVVRVLRAIRYRRLGLLGSRERVEMVGGVFTVESESGRGTTVRAEIPFRGS